MSGGEFVRTFYPRYFELKKSFPEFSQNLDPPVFRHWVQKLINQDEAFVGTPSVKSRILDEAIARLSMQEREVVELRYFKGYTTEENATLLGTRRLTDILREGMRDEQS